MDEMDFDNEKKKLIINKNIINQKFKIETNFINC